MGFTNEKSDAEFGKLSKRPRFGDAEQRGSFQIQRRDGGNCRNTALLGLRKGFQTLGAFSSGHAIRARNNLYTSAN